MNRRFWGNLEYINSGTEMEEIYLQISKEDEKSAQILYENRMYNQAFYFLIQAMEKYVKSFICKKLNVVEYECYAQKLREAGHSFDEAIDLLIEIFSENREDIKNQVENQIKNIILQETRFSMLHNDVRYPYYNMKKKNYKIIKISKTDYEEMLKIFIALKKTLNDLYRFM